MTPRTLLALGSALAVALASYSFLRPESPPIAARSELAAADLGALDDDDRDGLPDFLQLHDPGDRDAFRAWFTLLAEHQFFTPTAVAEVNDCAALLRFAFREALRRHDAAWLRERALQGIALPTSVQAYEYPRTPLRGELFRVRGGLFQRADLRDGTFAQFADARTLMTLNMHLVARDLRPAQPGDLLFYRQLEQRQPYHVIIFVGQSRLDPADRAAWTVYHTGPDSRSKGEVRRVTVADLLRHADARWRPESHNPNFLGVYRWNILKED